MKSNLKEHYLPILSKNRVKTQSTRISDISKSYAIHQESITNQYLRKVISREKLRQKILEKVKLEKQQFAPSNRNKTMEVNKNSKKHSFNILNNANKVFLYNHYNESKHQSMNLMLENLVYRREHEQPPQQKQFFLNKSLERSVQSDKYNSIQEKYEQHLIKNEGADQINFQPLIVLLKQNNCLFQKVSQLVCQSILKLGRIKSYESKKIIYKEYTKINQIGIILWGQMLLKNKKTSFKHHLFPGDSFGEEVRFERVEYDHSRLNNAEKGEFQYQETAKAYFKTSILYLGLAELEYIYEEFAKKGQKDKIILFLNILKRSYLKKKDSRKEFG